MHRFLSLSLGLFLLTACLPGVAGAESFTMDGPGFKMEKKRGWFHRDTGYQDALGNRVEKHTGFFGRTTTRTRVFGAESVRQGNNVSVRDASGNPLITTRKTWFHGRNTHVDGNAILKSVEGLFGNQTSPSPSP